MKERSLVAFTLLAQLAVGAFLTLVALDAWAEALARDPAARALTNGILLAIGPVIAVALAASLLHLGSPALAWRAIANVRGSWLSREVLLAILFAALGAAFAALRATGRGAGSPQTLLAAATALSGIALVYAMARVYRVRTVPAWDSPRTTASFFVTTLLLGALGVGAGLALLPGAPESLISGPLRGIALVAAVGFGARLAAREPGVLRAPRRALLLLGLVLSLGLLAVASRAPALPLAAFAAALAAETLGRYRFYVEGLRRPL